MSKALWVVQVLLAVMFVVFGGAKLTMPAEALTATFPFPADFIRFIGVCEVLAALGLVLPGLLRIRTGLTPLAAAGLVVIMAGATITSLAGGAGAGALVPLVLGLLAALVAYGRTRLAPLRDSSHAAQLQSAS